jgi:hypothetical protein
LRVFFRTKDDRVSCMTRGITLKAGDKFVVTESHSFAHPTTISAAPRQIRLLHVLLPGFRLTPADPYGVLDAWINDEGVPVDDKGNKVDWGKETRVQWWVEPVKEPVDAKELAAHVSPCQLAGLVLGESRTVPGNYDVSGFGSEHLSVFVEAIFDFLRHALVFVSQVRFLQGVASVSDEQLKKLDDVEVAAYVDAANAVAAELLLATPKKWDGAFSIKSGSKGIKVAHGLHLGSYPETVVLSPSLFVCLLERVH